MSDSVVPTASGDEVKAFLAGSGRTKVDIEPLFGFTKSAKGKNLRRWELYGAPAMATILMAYMNEYGFELAEKLTGDETARLIPQE